jgi:hypothetical protein
MTSAVLQALTYQKPIRVAITKYLVRRFSLFSYPDRLRICAVDRPHYGHCIFEAAQQAARLKYPKISVVEFGCGGGNGLLNAEMHIAEVEKLFPVKIELYGFDTGQGLPPLEDYRDFPHYFRPGQYHMDPSGLKQKLKRGKLVLGNVKDTCKSFFSEFDAAPVGCVFHDLDFYSSTSNALTLFDAGSKHFLPRVFMYLDDIIGNNTWLPSEFAGELLAVAEFNHTHATQKIAVNRSIARDHPDQWWQKQIYIYHDFDHPGYNSFIANDEQVAHEGDIRLR